MRLPALPAFSGSGAGSNGRARWALSFADLCLVLLGFLLMLQAHRGDPAALGAGVRAAFGSAKPQSFDEVAAGLFEPGEAVLSADARARFQHMGRTAAIRNAVVHVESLGTDRSARRFDAWELSAARAAAIARAIGEGGLDAQRIDLSIDGTGPAAKQAGQHIRVTLGG
jgi:hypothetical protein